MPLKPNAGRALSAAGSVLLVLGLFLVWYHIDRPSTQGTTDTTGWQTFTRLRYVIVLGAVAIVLSALLRQTRPVVLGRALIGLVLGALIVRRIVDPPSLGVPIHDQVGVYVGVLGAIGVVLGGLVDTGREVIAAYPDLPIPGRRPVELPPAGGTSDQG